MHAYYAMGMESKKDGREKEKEKVQSVYPGQSLKIYSNPINQKSLDILKLYRSHFWSQNLK